MTVDDPGVADQSRTGPSSAGAPSSVPVYGPLVDEDDIEAVVASLRRGWLGMGQDTSAFEAAVHAELGAPHRKVVSLSTGFAAMHVALLVAGVGPGDEVVVPSLCHLSDVQAILAVGAEPVFADVDDADLCLSPAAVADALTPATKAVIPLDYGCHLYDAEGMAAVVAGTRVRIVRDAAHAFGSTDAAGRKVGATDDLTMFSFDPVKSLTALDCGMLVLSDEAEHRLAQEIRLLGSDQPPSVMYKNARTWDYDAVTLGYRYHVTNLHGALGVSQMAKLPRIRASRQAACARYADNLKGIDAIRAPQSDTAFGGLNPFMYFVRVPASERAAVVAHLLEDGISTGLHWRPGHHHTFFQRFRRGDLAVTEEAGATLITLPLHSDMSLDLVDRISERLVSYFR